MHVESQELSKEDNNILEKVVLADVCEVLAKYDGELQKIAKEVKVYYGDYSMDAYYTVSYNDLMALYEEIKRRIEERKAKAEEERRKKFEEAKRTGKPVMLYSYTEPCNDPREDCDIDTIIVYAMPDGTIEEKRYHNW